MSRRSTYVSRAGSARTRAQSGTAFLRRALIAAGLGAGLLTAPGGLAAQQQVGARPMLVSQHSAWIGLSADFLEAWSASGSRGNPVIVVTEVHPQGPAARAGMQAGDTILRVNGAPANLEVLNRALSRAEPGKDRVSFTYSRGGKVTTIPVLAADRPPADRLITLPLQIRVQVDSIHQMFEHYLDSTGKMGLLPAGEQEGSRVLLFRIPEGGSAQSVAAAVREVFPLTALAFDSIAISIEAAASPDFDPFEVSVVRPSQQVAVSGSTAARGRRTPVPPPTAPRPPEPRRPPAERVPRPLDPYIVGQDWIAGARLTSLNPGLAGYFGVERGLLVVDVATGTLASDAGVSPGDVILQAGGRTVTTLEELRAAFGSSRTPVLQLTVVRKGRPLQLLLRR
jgi:membrane-associated protease RseP (regulator of RpoE activity)